MCRWSKAIHRVDLLVSASQHLFSLSHISWRPAVAAYIYMTHIFPAFELFVALEENPQLLAIASAGASASASVDASVVAGNQQLVAKLHSKQTQVWPTVCVKLFSQCRCHKYSFSIQNQHRFSTLKYLIGTVHSCIFFVQSLFSCVLCSN